MLPAKRFAINQSPAAVRNTVRPKTTTRDPVLSSSRRIRLGIWGLGRGTSFIRACNALNIDVVAGCDFDADLRASFAKANPNAFVTDDDAQFLGFDMDAVLVATYCPNHAQDAIRALKAGKHVLSEVTAFFTMAQGVELVETVRKTGKVYNLAENYPFTANNMYLARLWKQGLFGELHYAEFEYVHGGRGGLTYPDGKPVQPGWSLHHWRTWINYHYYCTHSLGPVMVITGTRPVRVTSLPSKVKIAAWFRRINGLNNIAPSLIQMSNGGLVRNLMGGSTSDSHVQRLWGTLGAAEQNTGHSLQLRLGGSGSSPKFAVKSTWDTMGELAKKSGHGGGDFWVLYYFAREILTGKPGPFDIYGACDVSIPGILAYRSSCENGQAYDVPDFRKKKDRDLWRKDEFSIKRYNVKNGCFPPHADRKLVGNFTATASRLLEAAGRYRAFAEWSKVQGDILNPNELATVAEALRSLLPSCKERYRAARDIARSYPDSDGGLLLSDLLEFGYEKDVLQHGFEARTLRKINALVNKYGASRPWLHAAKLSPLLPARDIRTTPLPPKNIAWKPAAANSVNGNILLDIRAASKAKDGIIYVQGGMVRETEGKGTLGFGADGPFRLWLNGKPLGANPKQSNPATPDEFKYPVAWKAGENIVTVAMRTNNGAAWGCNVHAIA